jgi:hypothetical protein
MNSYVDRLMGKKNSMTEEYQSNVIKLFRTESEILNLQFKIQQLEQNLYTLNIICSSQKIQLQEKLQKDFEKFCEQHAAWKSQEKFMYKPGYWGSDDWVKGICNE